MRRARLGGLTVVEVIVALAVLAINLLGWLAAVQLIVVLLQRTVFLLESLDPFDLAEMCVLGAVSVPTLPMIRAGIGGQSACQAGQPFSAASRGFTLVEVLVALALSGAVFAVLTSGFASTTRFTTAALAATDELSVRLALPEMLRQAVEMAGRGVTDSCALTLPVSGERLVLTHAQEDGQRVVDEVFAALDGGGRPALYLRRVPHPRQPWIEEVTSFRVVGHKFDDGGRVESVRVALTHRALDDPLELHIALPHRPCLGSDP